MRLRSEAEIAPFRFVDQALRVLGQEETLDAPPKVGDSMRSKSMRVMRAWAVGAAIDKAASEKSAMPGNLDIVLDIRPSL